MDKIDDNLRKLLGEEADKVSEQLRKGDLLLSKYPAPKPSLDVIENIKHKISGRLVLNKRRRFILKSSEMAAAVLLVAGVFVSVKFLQNRHITTQQTQTYAVEWNISEDNEYSLILNELENIESRITTIRLDEDEYEYDAVTDIEMEMLDIEDAFWKG